MSKARMCSVPPNAAGLAQQVACRASEQPATIKKALRFQRFRKNVYESGETQPLILRAGRAKKSG
jgi:hypothetical protein